MNLMRSFLVFSLLLFVSCNFQEDNSSETTTYYFIRHAEKDTTNLKNNNPELREEGWERAANWAEVFKEIPLDLIYASQYKRTQQTAKPTAEAHNLPIDLYNTSKLNDQDFQEKTKGKNVLVVGHSDITPEFVNYIIGEEKYETIEKSEFGNLYMITIGSDGRKSSRLFHIN